MPVRPPAPAAPTRAIAGARRRGALIVARLLAVGGAPPAAANAVDFGATGAVGADARRAGARPLPRWSWPVPPPIVVVAPFRAPPTPYAAGHRGIDLAVAPGAAITAAAAGTVSFAGAVAGRGVVAIDHGGGVVSAIEPVAATVAEGVAVSAGDVIGTVSSGGHCSADCVHFGVRIDGEYVSPFLFLGGLPRAVLLPMAELRPRMPTADVADRLPIGGVVTDASRARMRRLVALLEPLRRHVGVDLRRAEARVAEELLHGAQVGAAVEEVRRGAVPQRVRPARAGARDGREQRRDLPVHAAHAEAAAAHAEEHRRRRGHWRPVPSPVAADAPPRAAAATSIAGRATSRYRSSARAAGAPYGTTRSFAPLPVTRTVRRRRSTSARSRPTSSDTRSAEA